MSSDQKAVKVYLLRDYKRECLEFEFFLGLVKMPNEFFIGLMTWKMPT